MTWSSTAMGRVFVNTIDPENIKAILATNFNDFGLGHRLHTFGPLLGSGIFTTDGTHWEHSRVRINTCHFGAITESSVSQALVRPNFSKAQIQDLNNFEVHIQKLINQIPRDGSTVDLQPLFFRLTLDSATEFLFGESVNSILAPSGSEQQIFASAFDYAQSQLLYRRSPVRFLAFSANRRFNQACKTVHDFADKFVHNALAHRASEEEEEEAGVEQKKRKQPGNRYVFLTELAKVTTDPRRLRDELLNILLAGRDTTASLLSNTFHVLARRPDIWSRLQVEVAQLHGQKPDYDTLRNMKYVKHLLNECKFSPLPLAPANKSKAQNPSHLSNLPFPALRLYPVVPTNSRYATTSTHLPRGGGPAGASPIHIPAGQGVSYSVYALHRRADVYGPDAHVFDPDRWGGSSPLGGSSSSSSSSLRPGWAYLPFNGGPRTCPGQQFALAEAAYAVVRLCQAFGRVEVRGGGAGGVEVQGGSAGVWREQFGLTTASAEGVVVGLVGR